MATMYQQLGAIEEDFYNYSLPIVQSGVWITAAVGSRYDTPKKTLKLSGD